MDIITSHLNADFDSFAAMAAAKKLYPEARPVFSGSQEKKVGDFIAAFHPLELYRIRDIDLSQVKRLIVVDTKTPERIGPFAALLSREARPEVHVYDHHPAAKNDIHGNVEVFEEVGATVTIFVEILRAREIVITPMEATLFCLGIYEETGSLLFPSTTERDVLAVAHLLKRGASLSVVSNFIKTDLSREELNLLNELVQSAKEVDIGEVRIKIAKAVREDYIGDAAQFAHRIMDMEDIDGLVLLLDMQGKILMVGRSRAAEFDVAGLMRNFGGGGHPLAAAATVKDSSLELVEDELKRLLVSSVRPAKNAADVMAAPVITIEWDETVQDAETRMTRYGVNVLPVVKAGEYKGIISREVVEKAIFHGFGKQEVSDFTTTDELKVQPETSVRDIERLMIEQNQRFMPVMEGDKIVGAITRTDILRTLYEDMLRRNRVSVASPEDKPSMGRNLATWLKEKFPHEISAMLRVAGETADHCGFNAYLVGGSVRDLLRGQENLDIDIVIEGEGIKFAKELGLRLDARVRTHERFGTAQVLAKTLKLDIATARTEYYESPAVLPTIETSSIKKDLYRRDFTINALAVKLNQKDFGLLIDFFGGQRDLREKTIRVLHNLSFIEDPTRAFRAIRFSERFGFKLSKHTENLIKAALRMNLFDRLSGSRLYEELLLTFEETEPVKAVKRLSENGLLKVIHPSLVFDHEMENRFQTVHDTLSWFNLLFLQEKPDKAALYLMTLLSGLAEDERETALDRLSAPVKTKEKHSRSIRKARDLIRLLPLQDNAKIYRAVSSLDIEAILFAMALTPDNTKKRELSHYLLDLRNIKPLLSGDDLKKMGLIPGPFYSDILRALLEEKLKGGVKTREDEEEFIKKSALMQKTAR